MKEVKTYNDAKTYIAELCGVITDELERNIERVNRLYVNTVLPIDDEKLTAEEMKQLAQLVNRFQNKICLLCEKTATDFKHYNIQYWDRWRND